MGGYGGMLGDKAVSLLFPPPLAKLWKTRVGRSQALSLPSSNLSSSPPSHAAIAPIAQAPGLRSPRLRHCRSLTLGLSNVESRLEGHLSDRIVVQTCRLPALWAELERKAWYVERCAELSDEDRGSATACTRVTTESRTASMRI